MDLFATILYTNFTLISKRIIFLPTSITPLLKPWSETNGWVLVVSWNLVANIPCSLQNHKWMSPCCFIGVFLFNADKTYSLGWKYSWLMASQGSQSVLHIGQFLNYHCIYASSYQRYSAQESRSQFVVSSPSLSTCHILFLHFMGRYQILFCFTPFLQFGWHSAAQLWCSVTDRDQ